MFPWVTFMPIPDESSEPDGASKRSPGQTYKDRQKIEGRGRQGEKHKAGGKQSGLRSAGHRAKQRNTQRDVWGNLFADTLSPHFSPLGHKHQGQAQKTYPNPTTINQSIRPPVCRPRVQQEAGSQGLEHSVTSPSPSSPNLQPSPQTTLTQLCTHARTHTTVLHTFRDRHM